MAPGRVTLLPGAGGGHSLPPVTLPSTGQWGVAAERRVWGRLDQARHMDSNSLLISCDLVSPPLSPGPLTCKMKTEMLAPRRVGQSFPGVGISPKVSFLL